jgi:tRNA(adenine34) deaminase
MPDEESSEEPVIDLHADEHFMGEAIRQAEKAFRSGEVPVGAVISRAGVIIARSSNQVETLRDATAHAEMLALTQAESAVGDWRLNDCDLFVTKEPCIMCAGAIVHCRIRRVVFGCSDEKAGGGGGLYNILHHPSLNHRCEISQGIRETESIHLLQTFFRAARRGSEQ